MLTRQLRFALQSAAPGATRSTAPSSEGAGRRFKVLLPSSAPAQLSLFALVLATRTEKDSRTR